MWHHVSDRFLYFGLMCFKASGINFGHLLVRTYILHYKRLLIDTKWLSESIRTFNYACDYYAFKIAHYALEQCSKILPFMLKLCFICEPVFSTNSIFPFSYK